MVAMQKYLKYKGNTHLENGRGRDLKKKCEPNDSFAHICIVTIAFYQT